MANKMSEVKNNRRMMEEIIRYCSKYGLIDDMSFYANGHKYVPEWRPNSAVCSTYHTVYYDLGEYDVTRYVEDADPNTVTLVFDCSKFYYAYNSCRFPRGRNTYSDINDIMHKYGFRSARCEAWAVTAEKL